MVTCKAHNLETVDACVGSNPTPATLDYRENMIKNGKIMHCVSAHTLRELVDISNELSIERNDVVGIVSGDKKYYLVYYYGGIEDGNPKD